MPILIETSHYVDLVHFSYDIFNMQIFYCNSDLMICFKTIEVLDVY